MFCYNSKPFSSYDKHSLPALMKIVNTYLRFMADGFSSFLGADSCCWQGTALFDL